MLQDQSKSPYHMDILDVLVDLQRDGFVKSIGGLNFPPNLIQTAEACGFHLESNQVSRSLLNRRPLVNYEKLRTISIIASSPLACGLLTDNFYDKAYSIRTAAFHKPLSKPQSQYLNTIRASFDNRQPLSEFFYQLMSTLHEISWKHNVSISSVALRWMLQQMQLDVVTTRVGRVDRSQSYREIFTFELDEDDLLKIELPERLKEK
jgi:diketogulonate reductase-like aldo/keto reductase